LHELYNKEFGTLQTINEETGEVTEEEINYISMPKSNSKNSFKLNYADKIDAVSENGVIIEDFNSVIYYYLIWKGEKWKQCEYVKEDKSICGKWFKLKNSNSKQKYCSTCATIRRLERQREYMKNSNI